MPLKTAVFREARPAQVFVVSEIAAATPSHGTSRNPFVNQVFVVLKTMAVELIGVKSAGSVAIPS